MFDSLGDTPFEYIHLPNCDHCGHTSYHIRSGLCTICYLLDVEKNAITAPLERDQQGDTNDGPFI